MKKSLRWIRYSLATVLLLAACSGPQEPEATTGPATEPSTEAMTETMTETTTEAATEAATEETTSLTPERIEELHALSVQFTEHLNQGDWDAAMGMLHDDLLASLDGKLETTWKEITEPAGAFVKTGAYVGSIVQGYEALEMTLVFENASMVQRTVFDGSDKIGGLHYRNGTVQSEEAVPAGITETAVTVDAGEGFPVEGFLTKPESGTPKAALVFVHGSGPNDRNETIGPNAVFRDLAHALSQKGFAVLRYDKRTFTHGASMPEKGNMISVDEEVTNDAVAAVQVLKSQEGIDADRVYLLGHSMGAGLLPHIQSKGADVAGYIMLAGSPRAFWEISEKQNRILLEEMKETADADELERSKNLIETESEKGKKIDTLADTDTLFGLPVPYQREYAAIDSIAMYKSDGLPLLILQGEKDRQVDMDDFALWQEGLKDHPKVTYHSYPELNHLFGKYTGEPVSFRDLVNVEYGQRTPVDEKVVDDIEEWLTEQAQ